MVHTLDTRQLGRRGIIAATALVTPDGVALFDCGPESTFEHVVEELGALGCKPGDVRHLFLSHIHLDHAGAAWRFARHGAAVHVHPRGAPHLADPSRLVESASRLFGAEMERLWGRIEPVPGENIRQMEENDAVSFGGIEIRAVETPGHASHHHVYHWGDAVFGGDIAGVRIHDGPPIPPFVPPELHVESWLQSIDRIRALQPQKLYLPHFGAVEEAIDEHFDQLEERVRRWSEWFRDQLRAGKEEAELRRLFAEVERSELQACGGNDDLVESYELADPSFMAVTANLRYWRKFHPGAIASPG